MSARTVFLSRLLGLFALILGLVMLLHATDFATTMGLMIKDPVVMLLIGITALSAGLAIVLGHNVWSGSTAAVVITVIGWLSLLRGLFVLFVPASFAEATLAGMNFMFLTHFYTVVFLIVGLYLTYAGFNTRAVTTA